jgi:cytochrome c553
MRLNREQFMKTYLGYISSLILLSVCSTAFAEEEPVFNIEAETVETLKLTPNLDNGKKVFKTCALCHSPEGWGTKDGHTPEIAGQHSSVIIKQLTDIRQGNRDNPTMLPFTNPDVIDKQDIADVAAYVERLKMSPENLTGPGDDLKLGEEIYSKECAECHGNNGEGDAKEFYPSIHGQNYNYLLRQLLWIKNGKRRNANRNMVKQLQRFTDKELRAVIDYSSRLVPRESKLAKPGWKNPDFPEDFIFSPRYKETPKNTE